MSGKLILLILVVLAALVTIPKTRARLLHEAQPLLDKVKVKIVPGRLHTMVDELTSEVHRGGRLPTQGKDWSQWLQYTYTSDPKDPWGHQYYLEVDRTGFTVGSMGPDGAKATKDDITLRHDNGR